MRWTSTRQSIKKGEPTVLAIAETLVAIVSAVLLYRAIGSAVAYVISVCLAPLLLLRTAASTRAGLDCARRAPMARIRRMFERFVLIDARFLASVPRGLQTMAALLVLAWVLLATTLGLVVLTTIVLAWAFASRIAGTLRMAICHPMYTLREVPANLHQLVVCTDFRTPPELLPGADIRVLHMPSDWQLRPFSFIHTWRRVWRRGENWVDEVLRVIQIIAFGPTLLLPVLYRMAVKATTPFYLPLWWAGRGVRSAQADPFVQVRLVRRGSRALVGRVLALFVIILFGGKVLILTLTDSLVTHLQSVVESLDLEGTKFEEFADRIVAPSSIPVWQIASFVNGVIAWWLFFSADRLLLSKSKRQIRDSEGLPTLLGVTFTIRTLLSTYSVVAAVYILASVNWPALKFGPWFPW